MLIRYVETAVIKLGQLVIATPLFICISCDPAGSIVSYPAPPGLVTSPDFKVMVNNVPVWVERIGSKLDTFNYSLYSGRSMEDLNVAAFSCKGRINVRITASEDISTFIIRPKSKNIEAKKEGKDLVFTLPGLWKWSLSIFLFVHATMCAGDFALLNFYFLNRRKKIYTWDDFDKKIAYFYEEIL